MISLTLSVSRYIAGLLLIGMLCAVSVAHASSGSYEAPLPIKLSTDPDLCAYVPCKDVIPGADAFSVRKGRPSYVEAYHTAGSIRQLLGYVFLSTDIVDIPAYSGKPVVTLIGMDTKGIITGIRILKHSEPILLVGIPEGELSKFIKQYLGKFIGSKIEIGKPREGEGFIGIDAISGATVTVIAENQVILRSGYEIAKQIGIVKPIIRPQPRFTPLQETHAWDELVAEGSVQRLTVQPADVGMPDTGSALIDMYFGDLNVPTIGQSILGKEGYTRLMAGLKPGEHAIFIIANGSTSFKGSGFVRGGIFDRIQVSQDIETFTFRDTNYRNLYGVQAQGAPAFRESGIFIIQNPSFNSAYPWSLVFLANKIDPETSAKTFTNFDSEYWLPARYLEGGRPAYQRDEPTWVHIWKSRIPELAAFVLLLIAAATAYGLRDRLVRRARRKDKRWVSYPKFFIWTCSAAFVGYYAMAQPSITQVMAWFHSLFYQWKWELFLSDPFIFIFWWFIITTTFVWGRGLFCGWLCPFGSLTELIYKIARSAGLKRFQFVVPMTIHDYLKWTKYFIFAGLLAVSFYSLPLAEKLAEIEPFKTTFLVGVWSRSWPFVLFWSALIGLSVFTERPFCKYLCPLGAGLAIPTTFRFFGLKRKAECTTCHSCAKGCGSNAIDTQGRIDQRECLLCLDCMVMYYDVHACPPLSKERKRRERAGLPLTPIAATGYFVPLTELKRGPDLPAGGKRKAARQPVSAANQ